MLDAQDVLDLLNMDLDSRQQMIRRTLPTNSREALLYQVVGDEPLHVDEICTQVKMPIEEVTSTLALMELKGYGTENLWYEIYCIAGVKA